MTEARLRTLLSSGESIHLEYKQAHDGNSPRKGYLTRKPLQ